MRAAVYSGTKNLYPYMINSAKSLLKFSNVEKIYFLIQDDVFPYQLPQIFECINITKQNFIKQKPRVQLNTDLTFMIYIRAAYPKIFSHLDKILTIDCDTLICDNISELWQLDLTNYYLAAVPQKVPQLNYKPPYINMGVAMLNLQLMREEYIDDKLINALQTKFFSYNQQDAFNEICKDKIFLLPTDYNYTRLMNLPTYEKIKHYPGVREKYKYPEFNFYNNVKFEDIKRNTKINYKLDIIIPTYKNQKGLINTLDSIGNNDLQNINIIVINDCDGLDYSNITQKYPYIKFYSLEQNIGPGMVRQFGMDHSNNDYLMFMDTGDLFEPNAIKTILKTIKDKTYYNIFTWAYYDRNNNIIKRDINENTTIGFVYKRMFLQIHHVHFFPECTMLSDWYLNELCRVLNQQQKIILSNTFYKNDTPIFRMTLDENSITQAKKQNNSLPTFILKNEIPWLIKDEARVIDMALENKVHPQFIAQTSLKVMYKLYYLLFVIIYQDNPKELINHWQYIRWFYFNYYKPYSQLMYRITTRNFFNIYNTKFIKFKRPFTYNYNRFIEQLEQNENLPEHYLKYA